MSVGAPVVDGYLKPAGFSRISNVATSQGIGTIPNNVTLTLIQAESQDVRWRDDGVAPTAAIGMLLAAGDTLNYNGDPSAIRFIETTATATLNVTFYT